MKKLIVIVCVLLSMNAFGQQEKKFVYCDIVGISTAFQQKVKVDIEFGQTSVYWSQTSLLKDNTGNIMKFTLMIDALNYMISKGWALENIHTVGAPNYSVFHYIMRKEVSGEEYEKIMNTK